MNTGVVLLTLSDGIPTEDELVDSTLSTLIVGVSKIGSAVGVAGKVMIGSPKESTLDGGVGIISMPGAGMENGGGPVVVGNATGGKLVDGRVNSGKVTEGKRTPPSRLA